MSLFRIKRTEDNDNYGHVEAYMTSKGEYGTEEEASFFSSVRAACNALKNDRFNHTGDYRYDIESMNDEDD